MTEVLIFDGDVVENNFCCPECGSLLWDPISNSPGEALGTDMNDTSRLCCVGCGTDIGAARKAKGSIAYKVNSPVAY